MEPGRSKGALWEAVGVSLSSRLRGLLPPQWPWSLPHQCPVPSVGQRWGCEEQSVSIAHCCGQEEGSERAGMSAESCLTAPF